MSDAANTLCTILGAAIVTAFVFPGIAGRTLARATKAFRREMNKED